MKKTNIFWKVKARDKVSPARLFADTDRDGVANVFDCRPFNKFKQDNKEDNYDWDHISDEELERQQKRMTDKGLMKKSRGWLKFNQDIASKMEIRDRDNE